MVFVNKIAAAAEGANHHPDILINYNKVTLTLVSHDSGGVTQRDIRMAGKINEIAERVEEALATDKVDHAASGSRRDHRTMLTFASPAIPATVKSGSACSGCAPIPDWALSFHSFQRSGVSSNLAHNPRIVSRPLGVKKKAPILPAPNAKSGTNHLRIGCSLGGVPQRNHSQPESIIVPVRRGRDRQIVTARGCRS